jgi:hypothetical protein
MNGLLESFLIQIRGAFDFLRWPGDPDAGKPTLTRRRADFSSENVVPLSKWAEWQPRSKTIETDTFDAVKRISKQVAHITMERGGEWKSDWGREASQLLHRLESEMRWFVEHYAPERAWWRVAPPPWIFPHSPIVAGLITTSSRVGLGSGPIIIRGR